MKNTFSFGINSVVLAAALAGLGGCVPLMVGGVLATGMVASDRRTSCTVVED